MTTETYCAQGHENILSVLYFFIRLCVCLYLFFLITGIKYHLVYYEAFSFALRLKTLTVRPDSGYLVGGSLLLLTKQTH